jgi:hypothetical protein
MKKERKSKLSQMKINEMIFMVLALVLFFVIALLFYLSIIFVNIKSGVQQSSRDRNIMLVSRLADSPEFGCGASKANCIDTDKLIVLMSRQAYAGFWVVDGLVVEKISQNEQAKECSIGNYPNCNVFTIVKQKNNTIGDSSIVSLCRIETKNSYVYDKCEIGKISVWSKK